MIIVNRLGKEGKIVVINAELIEYIEEIPDTIIILSTGKKFIVKEKKEEIINLVIEYKKSIFGK